MLRQCLPRGDAGPPGGPLRPPSSAGFSLDFTTWGEVIAARRRAAGLPGSAVEDE